MQRNPEELTSRFSLQLDSVVKIRAGQPPAFFILRKNFFDFFKFFIIFCPFSIVLFVYIVRGHEAYRGCNAGHRPD